MKYSAIPEQDRISYNAYNGVIVPKITGSMWNMESGIEAFLEENDSAFHLVKWAPQIYYIRYDEYADNISYFTNILKVS